MNESIQQQKRTPVVFKHKIWLMLMVGSAILIVGYFSISFGLAVRAHRGAEIEFTARNYNRAVELAEQAVRLYPFPQWTAQNAYELLVRSLIQLGYFETGDKGRSLALFQSAQDAARQAQKLYPQEALFLTLEVTARRARIWFLDHSAYNEAEIIQLLDLAAALSPRLADLQFERGLMYFIRADTARPWNDDPDTEAAFRQSLNQAKAHLEDTLRQDASFAAAHLYLAHVMLDLGAPEDALVHAQRYIAMVPVDPYGYLLEGTAWLVRGKESAIAATRQEHLLQAVDSLNTAVRLNPAFPLAWEGWWNLAVTHNLLGAYADARGAAERAIQEMPEELRILPGIYKHLGDAYAGLYFESGSQLYYQQALEAYQTALRLNPQWRKAQTALDNFQARAQ